MFTNLICYGGVAVVVVVTVIAIGMIIADIIKQIKNKFNHAK